MGMSQTVVGDHYLGHDLEGDVVGQTAVQLLVFSRRILDSFLDDSGPRVACMKGFAAIGGWIPDGFLDVHLHLLRP
jgi:hypothetical protein